MAILISYKGDFRAKKIIRDRERHYYIMIKLSIHQENIAILSVYATHNRITKYMEQKLIELKK